MKYKVLKRIINNYLVEVEADSPENAIRKAEEGDHAPGELCSEYEDGDTFYPSDWRVFEPSPSPSYSSGEINFGIDRNSLRDLD